MATPNAPKAGQKAARAASKADAPNARAPKDNAEFWRARADELGVDSVAAREFDEKLIPEIQAAGYPEDQIKAILRAEDPYLAAKSFIAEERATLAGSLQGTPFALSPEQLAKTNLRDLKNSVEDAMSSKQRPSGIRGKDPNASQVVESNTPDTAAGAEMADTPGVPPVTPQPDKRKMSAERAAKMKAAATTKANVDKVGSTGSFDGVDWMGANRDPLVVGREAKRSDWRNLTAEDMTGERGPVWKQVDSPPPPDAPSQPAPQLEAAGRAIETPPGPSISETDPLLKGGMAVIKGAGNAIEKAWPSILAAGATAGGIGYYMSGGKQQNPQSQGGAAPSGETPIIIRPRESIRPPGSGVAPQPQAMPPAQQPIQPPPQSAPARPMQTTDIIRQLSRRMA